MKVAEFFAGIGLVGLGLQRHGWEIAFANDIDPKKYAMYCDNFPDANSYFQLGDIHHLKSADIPTVTLATASFPCNDLSLAGRYAGLAGKHSSTIWAFIRLVDELRYRRPPIILLENVLSFLTSNKGHDLANVLVALNKLGYSCDIFTADAAHFVPQSRQRLFVVGQLDDKRNNVVQISQVRSRKLVEFITSHSEIRWNIRPLPDLPNRTNQLVDILEDLPPESKIWWSQERTVYLRNQMSERHSVVADDMMHRDYYTYGTIFRRVRKGCSMAELRVDGIAGCLRTPRGGSGRQILFKAGKGKYFARLLTPRECARLQGVPDVFPINVSDNQALFGFGDAVCVPVIEWIAEHYLNPLAQSIVPVQQREIA